MTRALKTVHEYFEAIVEGKKTFDVRRFDRPFKVGDKLLLQEYLGEDGYSGEEWEGSITYILDNPEYCKKNYVILGIQANGFHKTKEKED